MLSKKIRAFKKMNPDAKNVNIAKTFNTSPSYVYQVLSYKSTKEKKVQAPTHGHQVLRTELVGLNKMLENAQIRIKNLEHQAIGYRSVISYLEGKLNGSTV